MSSTESPHSSLYEEYHPYGTTAFQVHNANAEVSLKRYRYTAKERDDETGLNYHGARYYAPWLTKWLSTDPIGVATGLNLYTYASNNPTMRVDHDGMADQTAEVVTPTPREQAQQQSLELEHSASKPKPVTRGPTSSQQNEPSPSWFWMPAPPTNNPNDRMVIGALGNMRESDYIQLKLAHERQAFDEMGHGIAGGIFGAIAYLIAELTTDDLHKKEAATALGATADTLSVAVEALPTSSSTNKASPKEKQTQTQRPPEPSISPRNRAVFEKYKDQLRSEMSKPKVSDPTLNGYLTDLYRENATIGSGSTAAAVRHEKTTGQPVGGVWHTQKAMDYSITLERWLNRNPNASHGDRAAAENVLRDIQNALDGK